MSDRLREVLVKTNEALGLPLHTEPTQDERDTWSLFADALSQRLTEQPDATAPADTDTVRIFGADVPEEGVLVPRSAIYGPPARELPPVAPPAQVSPAMDIESIVKQWREKALVSSSERVIATLETCANQLESYATSQRELRKGLEKLRELSEKATPGPWETEFSEYGGYDCMSSAWYVNPGVAVLDCGKRDHSDNPKANADAAFIVACVNFMRSAILEGKV